MNLTRLSALLCLCCALAPAASAQKSPAAPSSLSVTVERHGGFAGTRWSLQVLPDGTATLIDGRPGASTGTRTVRFHLSPEQRARLARTVDDTRFFSLADRYGILVPDGFARVLTVKRETAVKSVALDYQSLSDLEAGPKQAEARRAERFWDAVMSFVPKSAVARP